MTKKTALLLIDIQNDYFPGGKMELVGSLEASQQASYLLELFRQTRQPVVFVQHIATRVEASFFQPGTAGVEIHPSIQPQEGETVIQKHFPNSFRETDLLDHLHGTGITRLLICGMMTHMCVDGTVRAANDLGFECIIAGDACATRDLQFEGRQVPADFVHRSFLAALDGTYGNVIHAQDAAIHL